MKFTKSIILIFGILSICLYGPMPVLAGDTTAQITTETTVVNEKSTVQEKREFIDSIEKESLARLFSRSVAARELFDKAYGYAVFDNLKLAFIVSGAGGNGVAVNKETKERIYMKMGSIGIGFGGGGQKYQVVFLFQTKKLFNNFVYKGWQADAAAKAAIFTEGAEARANFVNGMAIYPMNEAGLMLNADIAGTKYFLDNKLNE